MKIFLREINLRIVAFILHIHIEFENLQKCKKELSIHTVRKILSLRTSFEGQVIRSKN